MDVNLTEEIAKAIGVGPLKHYGLTSESFTWRRYLPIPLNALSRQEIENLKNLISPHAELKGAKVALKDLDTWLAAIDAPAGQKARKLEHFESILTQHLLKAPGHRLYSQYDDDIWLGHYVTRVQFLEAERQRDYHVPARVVMTYIYERFGVQHERLHTFYIEDVLKRTVSEVLAQAGFYPETPEMRTRYIQEVTRYRSLVPMIGRQFTAKGLATDEIPNEEERRFTVGTAEHRLMLGNGDNPSKIVIDVFREKYHDDEGSSSRRDTGSWFWAEATRQVEKREDSKFVDPTEDVEVETSHYTSKTKRGLPLEDLVEDIGVFEVPVHPFLVVFDLQKHLRLSVHVSSLTEYVYDKALSDKLVLPKQIKDLVRMLVEHRSGFRDIIVGKGGGAIILLTGPPGVGKTLTAEVFAEAEQKPLYSVQASQLGTEPSYLEANLLKCIGRANRWKAVFLLDEADVYIHSRGNDLTQNAIVGVFLRILEYQEQSVIFLTTNRPDLVDDAIASRCIARIDYKYPSVKEQGEIWSILAGLSNIDLDPIVAQEFAKSHTNISGRDVKNLLKLAKLFSEATKQPITIETLNYALVFKPTL